MLKTLATLGAIGRTAMPGTWASCITAAIIFFISRIVLLTMAIQIALAFMITMGAFWLLWALDQNTDDRAIVIDEVAGMAWALVGAVTLRDYGIALILFRFFDITKLAGVGLWERLPRFWGIVADDLWAAVITLVIIYGIPFIVHCAYW